jgi:DNA primase small subunit
MGFIKDEDAAFVQRLFKRYYIEHDGEVYVPERIQEREFGYFTFSEKVMVRHIGFTSPGELVQMLAEKAPFHVYHSTAFYKYPRAPMDQKGWIGSELAFDIDADHLKTPCGKSHDFKVCRNCLLDYPADAERCVRCGAPLEKVEWVCESCLETARSEARKLLEILESDLGFEKIRLAFSGNRGYHIVVSDEHVLDLGQQERREIVDYVMATGLEPRLLGLEERRVTVEAALDLGEPGWRGRIARQALQLLVSGNVAEICELAGEKRPQALTRDLEKLGEIEADRVPWSALSPSSRRMLVRAAIEAAAAHVDAVVTQDIHRLIRLGNSLNGKTGLRAQMMDPNDLDDFDPMWSAVALPIDEEVHVRVIRSGGMKLRGVEIPPVSRSIVKLPLAAAVLLLCRGVATLP